MHHRKKPPWAWIRHDSSKQIYIIKLWWRKDEWMVIQDITNVWLSELHSFPASHHELLQVLLIHPHHQYEFLHYYQQKNLQIWNIGVRIRRYETPFGCQTTVNWTVYIKRKKNAVLKLYRHVEASISVDQRK